MRMPLTRELLTALEAKLNAQTPQGQRPCACGANRWAVHDSMILMVTKLGPGADFSFNPAASVTCAACGKTDLYNLKVLGLEHLIQPIDG